MSGHLIRMLLGLVVIGVLGMVSLFLINHYDKEGSSRDTDPSLSKRAFDANLP